MRALKLLWPFVGLALGLVLGLSLTGAFDASALRFRLVPPEPVALEEYERSVFSQLGEDGVIEQVFRVIEPTTKFAVEFGAVDGVALSNTRNLILNRGWSALLIEADHRTARDLKRNYSDRLDVKTLEAFVYPGNVEILFEESGVPRNFDLLVIDIDSNDYYVWKVMHEFRAKVVMIEINPYFPPPERVMIRFHPMNYWDYTDYAGASLESMTALANRKGYELIYCNGFNCIYVEEQYFPRFGIKDNSTTTLYKTWPEAGDQFNRSPQGRGDVPFEKPYLTYGRIQIEKKFIYGR